MRVAPMENVSVYTIGHSTRSIEQFVQTLKSFNVEMIVDVRTVPRSRTNPQYNLDTLPEQLSPFGIEHEQIRELGGLRKNPGSFPMTSMGSGKIAAFTITRITRCRTSSRRGLNGS